MTELLSYEPCPASWLGTVSIPYAPYSHTSITTAQAVQYRLPTEQANKLGPLDIPQPRKSYNNIIIIISKV